MVLKRLVFAGLGLLGMLGFGTAMGQGNGLAGNGGIPAPKFYGDITSCGGGRLPVASRADTAATSKLFGAMGLVETALSVGATDDNAVIGTVGGSPDATERSNLLGTLLLTGNVVPGDTTSDTIDCNNPIANGYAMATELYDEYVRTKGIADLTTATDDDRAKFRAAERDLNAYGGAVYTEVYNQQAKLKAADKAIDTYNMLVGSMGRLANLGTGTGVETAADGGRGYSEIVVDSFVVDTPGARITDTTDAGYAEENRQLNRVYGSMGVRGYQAIRGHTANGVTINLEGSADGAFNNAGALQRVSGVNQANDINTLGEIATELQAWETAVMNSQSALDAAKKAGNLDTRTQEESLRRATAGRDHVKSELNRLTSIVRNQNRQYVAADGTADATARFTLGTGNNAVEYTSERQVVDAYLAAQRQVNTAKDGVREAVKGLEDANKALMGDLGDADSYLSQLVRLREYEEAARKTELSEAGGADAAQSFKDAVTDAEKAVTAAKELQTTHMNLTGGAGSPGSGLLRALLETDTDKEDDGLALVNAVSDVHGATVNNKDEIDTLKGQLTDADGNPIDLTDFGNGADALTAGADTPDDTSDDGAVTTNSRHIAGLDARVSDNEDDLDEIWTDYFGTDRSVDSQHDMLDIDCSMASANSRNAALCADARSLHNEGDIGDPDDDIAETDETDNEAAPIVLNGQKAPRLRITFIPVHFPGGEPLSLDADVLMRGIHAYWPVADDVEAVVAPALESNASNQYVLLQEIRAMWNAEADPDEFYYGIFAQPWAGGRGAAYRPGRVAVSEFSEYNTIPHELGHNLNLRHPPGCEARSADRRYPYPDGQLGPLPVWDAV